MRVCAVIPVKNLARGKSRLAPLLSVEERINLSIAMLRDMLECLCSSPYINTIVIVSSDLLVKDIAEEYDAVLVVEDKDEYGVNNAVTLADSITKDYDASIVLPHDLPLIGVIDLAMLYNAMLHNTRCVIITPSSRLDGTNVLLRRPPNIIKTHYDEDSYILHVREALASNASVKILLSRRLMFDVDEPDDLYELLKSNHECNTTMYLSKILNVK
ncbi:MAG: 2-phospho-L-lactate guanylyltransferase [Candidatus Nitrosocaldus sp.]